MFRKFLLGSVGAIALASSALAAEPPPAPPTYLPPAPIFTWTGIYVGGQIGYAWTSGNNQFTGFDPFFPIGSTGTFLSSSVGGTPNGVIGGGNVGYNLQINQWVLGLEGDVNGTSLTNTAVAFFPDGTSLNAHSKSDIQGSIRGKVGIALGPRPDLRDRRRCLRRLQHHRVTRKHRTDKRWLSILRLRQRFDHPRRLDGRRRRPICRHQQLVGLCRISLYQLGQHQGEQFWAAARRNILQRGP